MIASTRRRWDLDDAATPTPSRQGQRRAALVVVVVVVIATDDIIVVVVDPAIENGRAKDDEDGAAKNSCINNKSAPRGMATNTADVMGRRRI